MLIGGFWNIRLFLFIIYLDIHCYNQSAIQVTKNPIAYSKMRHFELHFHYLRQLVQEKVVTLVYYKIDDQIIDILTNSISEEKNCKFHTLLGT